MTSGDVQLPKVNSLVGEDKGHGASAGDEPHDRASYDGVLRPPPGQGVDGVDNSKKPIHADTGNEENRAVHVPVEAGSNHTAHDGAEDPIIAHKMVEDLQGEHQGKEQISKGQIQHVDGCRLLGPDAPGECQNCPKVNGHTDTAHEGVEGRHEKGGKAASQKHPCLFRDNNS